MRWGIITGTTPHHRELRVGVGLRRGGGQDRDPGAVGGHRAVKPDEVKQTTAPAPTCPPPWPRPRRSRPRSGCRRRWSVRNAGQGSAGPGGRHRRAGAWKPPLPGRCGPSRGPPPAVGAYRRLGGEHHGVGPVRGWRWRRPTPLPGGAGVRDHRLEHLGGGDHRLAMPVGALDQSLLHERYLLERQLDAEVTARHHQGVGHLDDLIEVPEHVVASRSWPPA